MPCEEMLTFPYNNLSLLITGDWDSDDGETNQHGLYAMSASLAHTRNDLISLSKTNTLLSESVNG